MDYECIINVISDISFTIAHQQASAANWTNKVYLILISYLILKTV